MHRTHGKAALNQSSCCCLLLDIPHRSPEVNRDLLNDATAHLLTRPEETHELA